MTQTLVLGSLLGLLSSVIPGPFTALIAVTALQDGFTAGLRVALIPLASETGVLAVTSLLLSQLPEGTLRWLGVAGGLVVLGLGIRTFRASARGASRGTSPRQGGRTIEGLTVALVSPAPWVFWLLVGSPLFLSAYHHGWDRAAAFLGSFLIVFVGVYVGYAWAGSLGHRLLSGRWYRAVMVTIGAALTAGGGILLWQSWTGHIHRVLAGTEAVQEIVGDSTRTP